MIYVIGGTTFAGRAAAEQLVQEGRDVTTVQLEDEYSNDDWPAPGNVVSTTVDELAACCEGAESLVITLPLPFKSSDLAGFFARFVDAVSILLSQVKPANCIVVSSMGAHAPHQSRLLKGYGLLEQAVASSNVENTHIFRSGFALEHFMASVIGFKKFGMFAGLLVSYRTLNMTSERSAGIAAANHLLEHKNGRGITELWGDHDYGVLDILDTFGAAIDRPGLSYTPIGEGMAYPVLKGTGASDNFIRAYFEYFDAANNQEVAHEFRREEGLIVENDLQEFSRNALADLYQGL